MKKRRPGRDNACDANWQLKEATAESHTFFSLPGLPQTLHHTAIASPFGASNMLMEIIFSSTTD